MSETMRELVVSVIVPGNPVPKGRPRLGRNGHTYTPKRTVAAENKIAWTVKAGRGGGEPDTAAYVIEARFYERRQVGQEADGDNCLKTISDALNQIVWIDDTQVVEAHYWIERGASRPRTELAIYRLVESEHEERAV